MTSRQAGPSAPGADRRRACRCLAAELKELSAHHGLVIVERDPDWAPARVGDIRR
jgi:hypothetical protein